MNFSCVVFVLLLISMPNFAKCGFRSVISDQVIRSTDRLRTCTSRGLSMVHLQGAGEYY